MSDKKVEVIVYGTSWCPDCDRVKRFLLERDTDFRYVDIDGDEAAAEEMIRLAGGKRIIPVVRIGDEALVNPDNMTLGEHLGMDDADREVTIWDVLIVGSGVTGLSSAIYTTRERLTTVLVERAVPGGQIMTTAAVENYPGFPEAISGAELTDRLVTQAERFGARIDPLTEVTGIEKRGDCFHVAATKDGESLSYRARTVILAPGSQYRKLGVPGEKEYTGFGVSYCGTCDAPFYRDKHVVAVGGGNTAVDEGLHLLKFVKHLTMVNNLSELTASPFLVEELMKNRESVDLIGNSTVTEIRGDGKHRVTGVVIKDLESGRTRELACDGVFVWIGMNPNTDFLRGAVDLDAQGFIVAENCSMATATPGLLACGDVRSGSKKQIATAAGEGVIASLAASEYLKKQKTAE
jgi:thioredoxin reductase (NADPH)